MLGGIFFESPPAIPGRSWLPDHYSVEATVPSLSTPTAPAAALAVPAKICMAAHAARNQANDTPFRLDELANTPSRLHSRDRTTQTPAYSVVEMKSAPFNEAIGQFVRHVKNECDLSAARVCKAIEMADHGRCSDPAYNDRIATGTGKACAMQNGKVQGVIKWNEAMDYWPGVKIDCVATHPNARGAFAELLAELVNRAEEKGQGGRVVLMPCSGTEKAYAGHGFIRGEQSRVEDYLVLYPNLSPLWEMSESKWRRVPD